MSERNTQVTDQGGGVRAQALQCLMLSDPQVKVDAVIAAWQVIKEQSAQGCLSERLEHTVNSDPIPVPGRPALPELVDPTEVSKRKLGSLAGRKGFYHAIAHIEFNAINLALDAVYRFDHMPIEYYVDWWSVAYDEARHFVALRDYLVELGGFYGELKAHDGLWKMACDTDYDVLVRMALVPRVLEARGLDVVPQMIHRLSCLGDEKGGDILRMIQLEEIRHVHVGNTWYLHLCQQRSLEPLSTFRALLERHSRGFLSGPFNREARIEAGFTEEDIQALHDLEREFKQELANR